MNNFLIFGRFKKLLPYFLLLFLFFSFNAFSQNKSNQDEFSTPGNEFNSAGDEFSQPDDEFSDVNSDEFQSQDTSKNCHSSCAGCPNATVCSGAEEEGVDEELEQKRFEYLHWILSVLLFAILAGVFVRFNKTRSLRGFFLLTSLLVLGFYQGGCMACPIDGIQNLVLFFFLPNISWHYLIWFVGIIVITYLFGKVWCGWICHWGAIQEFLYLPGRYQFLQGEKVQKAFRISRLLLLIALISQLLVMTSKYWCKIDPFVNIFSFQIFADTIFEATDYNVELVVSIILTLLIIISSVFTYRPFCRSMCPVGLILGWISYIPGASVVGLKGECAGCKLCSSACRQDAIIRNGKTSTLRNSECILCGDCIDACGKNGLGFFRKSKKHQSKIFCKNDCQLH